MKSVIICISASYDLVSYGNGFAYGLRNKPIHTEIFTQGEDAASFIEEFRDHELAFPEMPNEERMRYFWNQYWPVFDSEPSSTYH